YLILERSLTRVLLGIILISNAINLLFMVASGVAGGAPIIGVSDEGEMNDPLPQAMVLTAIVITLGMTAFLLAMAYRSWQLNEHDEVQDDLEDRRIARQVAFQAGPGAGGPEPLATLDEEAAEIFDETEFFVEEHWLAGDEDEL